MTPKLFVEAALLWLVRRNIRGFRTRDRRDAYGVRIRGKISRAADTGYWKWWVEHWHEATPSGYGWDWTGWRQGVGGKTATRMGAYARVRIALRALETGTKVVD